ncbi:hypothetical protein J32TS6_14180 [Virgibacillus pantothenticus]|uniref:DUF4127 family protein n=1 Tax=Virgibacillus pantothenticus TaxID=1473 RepID=UPI001B20FB33|nr:DUF4127 family protein [Virgibacillus pantothenticus]GIP62863.1 hypothetical protein J32TS6_14180 [Virgibacillus pantothenticus]
MRVGVLPVDSRPCNQRFVADLGNIYGQIEIDTLPKKDCGYFMEGANPEAVRNFLINGAPQWDYLVLSVDMLCYGGLIQARSISLETDQNYEENRLLLLKGLKSINPQLKILGHSVIMRLSITASSSDYLEHWKNIASYSKYAHLAKLNYKKYAAILQEYKQKIPQDLLRNYLAARERNHNINQKCIDYVNENIIDYLDLCQEDSEADGLQIIEQTALREKITKLGLGNKVVIKNGTDEEVSLLFARCINETAKTKPKIYVHYMRKKEDFVALYEDRSLIENLEKSMVSSNVQIVSDIAACDFVLLVSPFPDKQIDLMFDNDNELELSKQMLDELETVKGYPYAFLDITYANGGSLPLLSKIISILGIEKLSAYSAWNTASNSIGTVLGQLSALYQRGEEADQTANLSFLIERIIDDCLYQGVVRNILNNQLKSEGEDVWNFSLPKRTVQEKLLPLLNKKTDTFLEKYYPGLNVGLTASFPWNRTFELDVNVTIKK